MWTTQARCPQGPQLTTADTEDCYRVNSKRGNQNSPRSSVARGPELSAKRPQILPRRQKIRSDSFWKAFAPRPILLFQKMRGWLSLQGPFAGVCGDLLQGTFGSSRRHLVWSD